MPISGCHDLPLATFNLPSRNKPSKQTATAPRLLCVVPKLRFAFPSGLPYN